MWISSDIVKSVHQVSSISLGYLDFRDVVERWKKYAVIPADDAYIADIDDKLLMGPYEIRTVAEDGFGGCLSL